MPSRHGPESARNPSSSEKQVTLPTLTHLQFLVLDVLASTSEGASSQEIQDAIASYGQDYRGPKFYQLMKRLERDKLLESWSQAFDVAGSEVTRTFYRATAAGLVSWRLTLQFYATRLRAQQDVFEKD